MKSKKKFKTLPALIVMLWAVAMGMLIDRHYIKDEVRLTSAPPPVWLFEEHWMGIYQGTTKIGYANARIEERPDGYSASENTFMRLKVMGVEKEMRMDTEAMLGGDMQLRSFSFSLDSDIRFDVSGTVKGDKLELSFTAGGKQQVRTIDIEVTPNLSLAMSPEIRDISPGDSFSIPMIDPTTLSTSTMTVKVEGTERITVMGLRRDTLKLKGKLMGTDVTTWITPEGEVLKEEAAGFTFIKESPEEAVKLGEVSTDLIADLAVPSDRILPDYTEHLLVRLKGADLTGLELDGGMQRIAGPDTVEITAPSLPLENDAPMSEDALSEYLMATFFVQSEDPAIVSLAQNITEGAGTAEEKTRLLYDWVFKNITKYPAMTIPSALEVLESRRGDCNEHTTLYTALARAAGLPTRIAVGIVHKDGYFYYHAWPEVYLGGWFPVDPTLGQYPADASHIRLLTGGIEKQVRIAGVFGKLRAEVLSYR